MSVIVYGPQGCGKTTNAERIRAYFGLSAIIEERRPEDPIPDDALVLTSTPGLPGALNYDEVMKQITR